MNNDNTPEQDVPQVEQKKVVPEEKSTDLDNESARFNAASSNLNKEFSDLATTNPNINLQAEQREMAILMDDLSTLEKASRRALESSSEGEEADIVERFHLEEVREKYKDVLSMYEISPLDRDGMNLGFVMKNKENPIIHGDFILTDLDDTMIGTQEVKSAREQLYADYLGKLGIDIPREKMADIIKTTDAFARWLDTEGGSKDCYHPIAHMTSLQLVTDALKNADGTQSVEEIISGVETTLLRIKGELDGTTEPRQGDPFRITNDGRFIMAVDSKAPWSEEMENIFEHTMIAPPRYERNISAFENQDAQKAHPNIDTVNTGVFTSGTPSYQLYKIGELLREYPDLQFNTLLLTRVGKDKFLKEFIKEEGIRDSMIVMYDDGISNVRGLENLNSELHESTGNTIVGVVAKTPFAKDADKESEFPTYDHDAETSDNIKAGLRLALKMRDTRRDKSANL